MRFTPLLVLILLISCNTGGETESGASSAKVCEDLAYSNEVEVSLMKLQIDTVVVVCTEEEAPLTDRERELFGSVAAEIARKDSIKIPALTEDPAYEQTLASEMNTTAGRDIVERVEIRLSSLTEYRPI